MGVPILINCLNFSSDSTAPTVKILMCGQNTMNNNEKQWILYGNTDHNTTYGNRLEAVRKRSKIIIDHQSPVTFQLFSKPAYRTSMMFN